MTMRRHPALLWLALLALLAARAVVPVGWMPVAAADGVRITLCTGQGLVAATLDKRGQIHPGEPAQDAPRDSCPYGALAQPAALAAPPALADTPMPGTARPHPLAGPTPAMALHAPRPPSRGPPQPA